MKNDELLTNEQIQKLLTAKIRGMDAGEVDPVHAKNYYAGVGKLLTSVKLDFEGAKAMGVPVFERTKRFLGVEQ